MAGSLIHRDHWSQVVFCPVLGDSLCHLTDDYSHVSGKKCWICQEDNVLGSSSDLCSMPALKEMGGGGPKHFFQLKLTLSET